MKSGILYIRSCISFLMDEKRRIEVELVSEVQQLFRREGML